VSRYLIGLGRDLYRPVIGVGRQPSNFVDNLGELQLLAIAIDRYLHRRAANGKFHDLN
jgi:hypothetical protein